MDATQIIIGKAEISHRTRRKILGHDIAPPYQANSNVACLRVREVQIQAALGKVDAVEDTAAIYCSDAVRATEKAYQVGPCCGFYLDDISAQITQPGGRVRKRIDPAEIGNPNAFEW